MTTLESAESSFREGWVGVFPFTRQDGGDGETIIGRPDLGVFLALPPDAVQVLDDLASGRTVREAEDLYVQRHGETPDLAEFLDLLAEKGFVRLQDPETEAAGTSSHAPVPAVRKYHFENLPEGVARLFFGRIALGLYGLVIAAGIWVAVRHPSLVPGRGALYFERYHTPKILSVVGLSVVMLFLHEMSHLLAARAVGVKSRLGISHRLWILVAETDLTGLWAVAKKRRYLPLLAGPLIDLVTASSILLCLFADSRGWIGLPPLAREMLRAVFFAYVLQLVWQLFFFVRTDLYYVIAAALDCKNLLGDTETFLRNQLARLVSSIRVVNQSHIPARERRVIHGYSAVWLFGRGLAFSLLFTVTLPLLTAYLAKVAAVLRQGWAADTAGFVDAVTMMIFSTALFGLGMGLWMRSLIRKWKPRVFNRQLQS